MFPNMYMLAKCLQSNFFLSLYNNYNIAGPCRSQKLDITGLRQASSTYPRLSQIPYFCTDLPPLEFRLIEFLPPLVFRLREFLPPLVFRLREFLPPLEFRLRVFLPPLVFRLREFIHSIDDILCSFGCCTEFIRALCDISGFFLIWRESYVTRGLENEKYLSFL